MKTSPTLVELPDGTYRLERELELAMNPPDVRPPLPLKEVGYAVLMVPVGLGILMGTLVGCVLVSGRGLIRKIWRAWK